MSKESDNKISQKSSNDRLGINKKNDKTSLDDATLNDGSEDCRYETDTEFSNKKKDKKIILNY